MQRADGGLARHLFEAGTDTPTSVTADGSRVLFTREGGQDLSTGLDIMVGPLTGAAATPVRSTQAAELNGEVSPDRKWLAYESNEASDLAQIYVRRFRT